MKFYGYWENLAWVHEWDGLGLWIRIKEHAQILDGGPGKTSGLGRVIARWRWAVRAWPTLCEWPRRGFGWWWSKAANDGLGDAAVA